MMTIRFDDIGNRLRAFRLGSGLSAEEVAGRIGISRTALYRFEKGELAKIDTLEKLAELLEVSIPTLLGVGVEYVASGVSYFERIRQLEATAERITVLAGPISYLLASDGFDEYGQPLTTNLADYLLITAPEVPRIRVSHHESPTPLNPLGVKGVGECGVFPGPAAIASAIEDALSPFGVRINSVPVSPADILAAIEAGRG